MLRYLWNEEGLFNEQIVRDGFATLATLPPDIKYVARICAAQQQAYVAGRGLWARTPAANLNSAHADRNIARRPEDLEHVEPFLGAVLLRTSPAVEEPGPGFIQGES